MYFAGCSCLTCLKLELNPKFFEIKFAGLLAAEADKGEGLRMLVQRAGGNIAKTVPKKLPEADTAHVRHAPLAAVSVPLDLGIQTNKLTIVLYL